MTRRKRGPKLDAILYRAQQNEADGTDTDYLLDNAQAFHAKETFYNIFTHRIDVVSRMGEWGHLKVSEIVRVDGIPVAELEQPPERPRGPKVEFIG